VFIDCDQPDSRQLWTEAHEGTHAMCEWHAPVLRLDNEETLFKELHPRIEAEAPSVFGDWVARVAVAHLALAARLAHHDHVVRLAAEVGDRFLTDCRAIAET
jgi:hypothetical protein